MKVPIMPYTQKLLCGNNIFEGKKRKISLKIGKKSLKQLLK